MGEETALPPMPAASPVQQDPAQAAGQTDSSGLPAMPAAAPVSAAAGALPPMPPAAPISAGPGGLPPMPPAAATVEQANQAQAQAQDKYHSTLDMLRDHGHIMQDLEDNATNGPNAELHKAMFGKGTFLGTDEKDLPGTENETWLKRKAAIIGNLISKPILNVNDTITPEERAAHPHVANYLDQITPTLTGLSTPASLAFMGAIGAVEAAPKYVEATMLEKGVNPAMAAKAAKTIKGGLTAMNAYFTYDQVKDILTHVPEVFQALGNGDYDKALGLATAAVVNGYLATKSFEGTVTGLHDFLPESTTAKAMAHPDYREAILEDQKTHQIGGGRSQQIADLGRKSVASELKRAQLTEYADAHGNRDVMAARQKETRNPVSPEQRIAEQGAFIPLDNQGMQPPPAEAKPAENAAETTAKPAEKTAETPKRPVTTLGPATTNEEGVVSHPILVDGKEVGHGTVKIEGDRATVDWVGGNATDTTTGTTGKGELTNQIGYRGMRDLAKQFLTQHPEINTVEGQRIGGANAGDLHPVEFTREQLLPKLPTVIDKAINDNPTFVSKAVANRLGLFDEEAKASAAKPAEGEASTFTSPKASEAAGLFSEEAKANAAKPGAATPEHWESPAARQTADTAIAVARAEEAARDHVITPEERDLMVQQQDPNFKLTGKQEKDFNKTRGWVNDLGQRAQKLGILGKDQLREWFVPREWDFEDASDPTKATLFDSHHEGQQHGLVSKNKDYYALVSDYYRKMTNRIANTELITRLKTGRTSDGAPLAVGGGFTEGQRVSTEGPQSHIMGEQEINTLKRKGQFTKGIESGRIKAMGDGSFQMNTDDFVKSNHLYEVRPIGPTPIPAEIVKEMQADGSGAFDKLKEKGLIYQNEKGEWMNKTQLYARVPVYLHPDIATHMNEGVRAKYEYPDSSFGKALKLYDDTTGNMKNMLLSWSPFHRVTEGLRMMESLGVYKGGKLAAQSTFGFAPKVDYFNLTPIQEEAIRSGIVVTDPRGNGANSVEEGLSGGSQNWLYKAADKSLGAGIEATAKKVFGASDETAAAIRRNINPQKILTDDVFGPHGTITDAKMALYADRKPLVAQRIKADHPDWSAAEVDAQAGKVTAEWANNKFGGLNYVLLGRSMSTQKFLKRMLLAPDFLESTGRSVVDVAGTHGTLMASRLLQFNIVHALTAAAINLALHHDENDTSPSGILKSSHIIDHPFGVVSQDGKSVYNMRTTMQDFLHMVNAPKEFAISRVSPAIKAGVESWTKRNEYGRAESQTEALKSWAKAYVPIQLQNAIGLGPNTTTEPSGTDKFLKSIGIQAKPNRTPAEQKAIDIVAQHLQGTEAREGPALVRSQMKFNAEDNLRTALAAAKQPGVDPVKAKERIDAANHAIDMMVQKKVLGPEDVKAIRLGAKSSRLTSIFNSLDAKSALDVWDVANDDERATLAPHMQHKYGTWREKLAKNGQNINQLNQDDQEIQDRFTQARLQATDAVNKPLPPMPAAAKTKPAAGGNAEKASPAAEEEPLPPMPPASPVLESPASLKPPKAPEIYHEGDYTPIVNDAAKKYGVDPTLVEAIMHRESAGNANAQSNKGALGLMQLEPETAKAYGVTNIKDPQQNIDAGTHYISDLLKQYDGDEKKALAAYNAGPTAVAQYGGVPPFKETKEYVKAVQEHKSANYQNSADFKPTETDAKMYQHWPKTGPSTAPGMVKPGNIDLTTRPIVHRPNGEVSSLSSASFGTDEGEVLVPLVSDKGKILTIQEAKKQYEKDGKSLGVFKTPEQADQYANFLHSNQGKFQTWTNGGQYRPSVETHSDK